MKKHSLFSKIIIILNFISAFLLLLAYLVPYIPPQSFPLISVLSLGFPVLILVNIIFFIYWLFRLKRKMWISGAVLILGLTYVNKLYQFSGQSELSTSNELSLMSYNVRLFNMYDWIKNPTVKSDIQSLVKSENPDIIGMQEFNGDAEEDFKKLFPYHYFSFFSNHEKSGQAIYSKYKIINKGHLKFKNTNNNVIYADIIKGNDTIRIYNAHLQSLGINPDVSDLNQDKSKEIFRNVSKTFQRQQDQVAKFKAHKAKCPYKTIVIGDFNNTAFSYTYNQMKGDLNDAFVEAGKGFGKTFDFNLFPMRIDFILTDSAFEVQDFKTFSVKLSDHYPVMAKLSLD